MRLNRNQIPVLFLYTCTLLAGSCADLKTQGFPLLLLESNPIGLSQWKYRRRLSIDNSGQASDLQNFPLLVKLTGGVNIDYSRVRSDGGDLRFADASGLVLLDYEIEKWNSSGDSWIWVRVPEISASSTNIYMYYGQPYAVGAENPVGVWASDYVYVNHMHPNMSDVSGRANSLVNNGTTDTQGRIGQGRFFNGTSAYIEQGNSGFSETAGSIMVWANPSAFPGAGRFHIYSHRNGGDTRTYILVENPAGEYRIGMGDHLNLDTGDSFSLNSWHLLTLTWNGSNSYAYLNGEPVSTAIGSFTFTGSPGTIAHIGKYVGGPGEYFAGALDEVRTSAVTRSSDWVRAQYLSMTDAFITYGSLENL